MSDEKNENEEEKKKIVIKDLEPKKDPKGGEGDGVDGGSPPPSDDPYSYP